MINRINWINLIPSKYTIKEIYYLQKLKLVKYDFTVNLTASQCFYSAVCTTYFDSWVKRKSNAWCTTTFWGAGLSWEAGRWRTVRIPVKRGITIKYTKIVIMRSNCRSGIFDKVFVTFTNCSLTSSCILACYHAILYIILNTMLWHYQNTIYNIPCNLQTLKRSHFPHQFWHMLYTVDIWSNVHL